MVLAGLGLFLTFLVATVGAGQFGKRVDTYTAMFSFSGGVKPGTIVRFGGVQVGQVDAVAFSETHPTMLDVRVAVVQGTPVRADSQMQITQLGMLSEYYVEITTGSAKAPLVAPGTQLQGRAPIDLSALFTQLEGVAGKLQTTLDIVNDQILTQGLEDFRMRVQGVFTQVETLLADLDAVVSAENREMLTGALTAARGVLEDNRADLRTTIVNTRDASASLRDTLEGAKGLVKDARPQVKALMDDLNSTIAEADQLMGSLDAMVLETRPAMTEAVENLNATAANARDLTETLSQEPWRLVWPPEQGKKGRR